MADLKYDSVINHIIHGIHCGLYPDQSKIPSEKALAEKLKVSVTSVREGLKQLCERSIIIKQQGRRSVINAAAISGEQRILHIGWIGHSDFQEMNPVYFETYSRTLSLLLKTNCHLSFLPYRTERDEANLLHIFNSFDGFFLAGIRTRSLGAELATRLQGFRNVLGIDEVGTTPANYTVSTNNYQGGVMMGEYLAQEKRKCPVLFLSEFTDFYPAFDMRNRGLIDSLSARQIPFVLVTNDDFPEGSPERERQVEELLKKYPKIDTIWHPQDQVAVDIRKTFEKVAPKPEGYYRSCGVDGLVEIIKRDPYHASIAHPFDELAQLCVETMFNFFAGKYPTVALLKIQPSLIPWSLKKFLNQ